MFTSLRLRLTVLYAALFGVALLVTAIAAYVSISTNAGRQVERELAAGGAVFDRLWAMRARQLSDGAAVLSRDFGFREAAATGDAPTVQSALDNLRNRLGLDRAMLVGADGVIVGGAGLDAEASDQLWYALDGGARSGVLMIGGIPHQAVAAPVQAPQLIGWVVFAVRLDDRELRGLERLSSIPLKAEVLTATDRGWVSPGASARDLVALNRFVNQDLSGGEHQPRRLTVEGGASLALAKPLATFGEARSALVLRYPLALAMAPYRSLLISLVLIAVAGLICLVTGGWLLARSITRPVQALDEAAQRLERGEDATVSIETRDEIGRLAGSFNAMAAGIREREGRITRLALTDQDTELPNRRALEQSAAWSDPANLWIAVLSIERFGQIRAAVGYRLAADLIREIGRRAAAELPGGVGARVASDRLALLIRAEDAESAGATARAVMAAIASPVTLDDVTVDVALTCGLARVADPHVLPPVDRASIAVDQTRASGGVAVFDPDAYGDPASKLSMMSEMLAALDEGSIALHYQAKHDIRQGRITGAEALLRWNHDKRGFIRPDLFVELAEETGHIRELTLWTVRRAVADQARMAAAGVEISVAVNLSGRLVGDSDFAEKVLDLCREAVGRITLEITETAVIDNPEASLEAIERYRAAGIGVAIDDYGSGLSSLAYLKQIDADELKIDRLFVMGLSENARDALLVKSTVDLAHSLGMRVVAEGVETAEGLAALTALGCDMAQGYFIARPITVEALIDRLRPADAPAKPGRRSA